jgi:hypothetical protein
MFRHTVLAAGTFLLASTIAASAGGIGFGITIGPGAFGPGLHSAPPPREYRPRARSYHEEARPRRQQRQNSDDDAKAAETAPPAKVHANENSSIALLTGKPDKAVLHLENSSIAGGPRPAEPAPSGTITVQLENSSIAATPRAAESAPTATVAVQAQNPIEQAASSHPVLCSRYYPTAGRTVQGPCE